MKKLITTAVLLLVTMVSFAQAGRIWVTNNSHCTIYYRIIVSTMSLTPICTVGGASGIIAIAPGTSVVYSGSGSGSSAIPGVTVTPASILGAHVYNGPLSCATSAITIGEPCVPYPPTGTLNALTPTCIFCNHVTAIWTPAASVDGVTCRLTFN